MKIMKVCDNWTIKFLRSYDIHELMKNSKELKEGAALFNYFFFIPFRLLVLWLEVGAEHEYQ